MRRALLTLTLALAAPASGLACGNAVELSTKEQTQLVAKAEALLEAGENGKAAKTLMDGADGGAMGWEFRAAYRDPALRARAHLVAAAAAIRGGEKVTLTQGRRRKHVEGARGMKAAPAVREALAWAARVVAEEHQKRPDEPAVTALHAEALTALGQGAEARPLLEKLAEADLMPGPDAWRTLAGLRAVADDAAGRDAALEKCKAVAPKAARCALDPGLGGS
ncbi:MAG: hypothetical protein H6706_20700 [Myxococcales bacterium]|nr:hypothetical protein [Myxococcales bacterium]